MTQISVGTSRKGRLWPAEHWKTLFDSLSAKGCKNDPRLRYLDLREVLAELVVCREERFWPNATSGFRTIDDVSIRSIEMERVAEGREYLRFSEADWSQVWTSSWIVLELPFFGTIGDSSAERQSRENSKRLIACGEIVKKPVSIEVFFELSSSRRDRDLDNLYDALAAAFHGLYPDIQRMRLSKSVQDYRASERLGFRHNAGELVAPERVVSVSRAGDQRDSSRRGFEPGAQTMASTVAEAIREALQTMGGEGSVSQVKAWIELRYPGRWKDVSTPMADLTFPGNPSSGYGPEQRFLERVGAGRYRLR